MGANKNTTKNKTTFINKSQQNTDDIATDD